MGAQAVAEPSPWRQAHRFTHADPLRRQVALLSVLSELHGSPSPTIVLGPCEWLGGHMTPRPSASGKAVCPSPCNCLLREDQFWIVPCFWAQPTPDCLPDIPLTSCPTLRFLLRPRPYSVAPLRGSRPCLHGVWPMCPGPTGLQSWAGKVQILLAALPSTQPWAQPVCGEGTLTSQPGLLPPNSGQGQGQGQGWETTSISGADRLFPSGSF